MDAYRLAHGSTGKAVEDFLSRADDAKLRTDLRDRLKLEVESGDAVEALLISPDRAILLAAGEGPQQVAPALHRAIAAALASHEAVFSDFYRMKNGPAVYVDAVEAVRDAAGHPLAVVAIRNDASSYLFPMIQSWPLPSRSAETLLVQRDGEEVVYLNKLRHRNDSAPSMRQPLSRLEITSVQAVLGKRGIFEGKDYRGVSVLSDLRAVPNSPWLIEAKVDLEEIFAESRFRALAICLIVGAFVMMFAALIAFLYRQWNADIAERNREAEQGKLAAVHEMQAILQAALDISQIGIAIADAPSGKLRYVNDAGLLIRGSDRQSVVTGVGVDQYVSSWQIFDLDGRPLDRDEVPLARAIRYGETCSLEFIIRRAVGDDRIVQANAAPIRDARGKVAAAIVVFMDITEGKQVQEELSKKNVEIKSFTNAVSHDLRGPLVTIKTFIGFLEDDLKTNKAESVAKDLGFIHSAADKMERMLGELLQVARIGHQTNPPVTATLQEIMKEIMDILAGQLAVGEVQVEITDKPIWLTGDRERLVEVFQNLVDNAVKFLGGQPQPRIEIGWEQEGGEVVLFVRDNGKGIDPRHQGKVFGLFQKLDTNSSGSGLGLALVRRIVELHGGRIWVQSEGLGQGTTFRFTLENSRVALEEPVS